MQRKEKKSLRSKSVAKSKKNEKVDADIISLIKAQKKTESNSNNSNSKRTDKSELEEDVELNFGDVEFDQFIQLPRTSEGKAPVLERVAREAPRPIFVGGIRQDREANSKEENSDDFKYVSSNGEKKESKYTGSSEHIYHESERIDINQMGRKSESFSPTNQETFFSQSSEAKSTSQNPEKAWRIDRFEAEKAGRKNPHERDETRYEKYKPSR